MLHLSTNNPDLPFKRCLRLETIQRAAEMAVDFAIETKYGTMTGRAGEYVMEGATGALYVISREDFDRCYRWR